MPASFSLSCTDKLRAFASGLVVPFCHFFLAEEAAMASAFFHLRMGRAFFSSLAGQKTPFPAFVFSPKDAFLIGTYPLAPGSVIVI